MGARIRSTEVGFFPFDRAWGEGDGAASVG